jgi:hypothetical protein
MNDRFDSPPRELGVLFASEREIPAVATVLRDRIYARLRSTLGFAGPGGGGNSGWTGLSGAGIGAILAVLLGSGGVAFFAVRALMESSAGGAPFSSEGNPTDRAIEGRSSAAPSLASMESPSGPPRFRASASVGAGYRPAEDRFGGSAREQSVDAAQDAGLESPQWFGQRGVEPRRIAGRVLDSDGRPLSRASVSLEGILSAADGAFEQRALTGPDGGFDFGLVSAWTYVVTASVTGRRSAVVSIDLRGARWRSPGTAAALREPAGFRQHSG